MAKTIKSVFSVSEASVYLEFIYQIALRSVAQHPEI